VLQHWPGRLGLGLVRVCLGSVTLGVVRDSLGLVRVRARVSRWIKYRMCPLTISLKLSPNVWG